VTVPADRIAEHLNLCFGPEFAPADSFSLAGMERALKKLERPQDRLPPTIHVAGTNGKGSTCAFMRAIAEAAGLSVHCFSKPHLHQTRERVRLAGKLVSDDEFIGAIDRVAATGERLRHFEGQVAAAFTLFADTPADLLILETGMGGTHDATNVIERPALCVLTPVDIDHAALLGPTRAAIARQKAGVLKVGARVIVARQAPDALEAIESCARSLDLSLARRGVEWDVFASHGRMAVQTESRLYDLPLPNLFGAHQVDNAGLAAAAMDLLCDARIDDDAIADGVQGAFLPGRMQRVSVIGPIGKDHEIWIDGAHNPHGARVLADCLRELDARASRPVVLIIGMLDRKDADGFLASLSGVHLVVATPIAGESYFPATDLVRTARVRGFEATSSHGLEDALSVAGVRAPGSRVVICGSLALAAQALRLSGDVG
jgi:dihydrofolate synthase/folylpolyglutamate synthase